MPLGFDGYSKEGEKRQSFNTHITDNDDLEEISK
jgi:hypothetical protein